LEGELAEEIETGKVEFTGWVDHDDVPRELNKMKLLVVPSQPTEGLPTAILEAMGCGTPVYATSVSGVPDVVREGKTGFLMDSVDDETIAHEIESILTRTDLHTISKNARSLVEEQYSFSRAVNRYRTILTEIRTDG
jgi:glycosyltransferase involved in cell wall biosynthesis